MTLPPNPEPDTGLYDRIVDRRRTIEGDLVVLRARIARLEAELEVLNDLVGPFDGSPPPTRFGPADAVRKIAHEMPGLSRRDLRIEAKRIVTTPPEKADKVLDQTIRNLLGKDIEEREGKFFLRRERTKGEPNP